VFCCCNNCLISAKMTQIETDKKTIERPLWLLFRTQVINPALADMDINRLGDSTNGTSFHQKVYHLAGLSQANILSV
jgi:hypothetical protein